MAKNKAINSNLGNKSCKASLVFIYFDWSRNINDLYFKKKKLIL